MRISVNIKQRLTVMLAILGAHAESLMAQIDDRGIDTTGIGYRIGREIGDWLPFLIIITLALLVIYRSYNFSEKE